MKPQIYYFGSLPGGFSSYPGDHTKTFFEQFLRQSKNEGQIVIHREGNLLHYGYVRKFSNNYFGICLCIDCIYNDVGFLFSVFDDVYADMINAGEILHMSTNGSLEWSIKSYVEESVALNEYTTKIIERINISGSNSQDLPPMDFSISINDCLEISLEMSKDEVVKAMKRYPNLYIVKTDAEIERVTSFIHTLKAKDSIIEKLKNENNELIDKNRKISQQKKQFTYVILLCLAVITCGIGLLLLNGSLNETKEELSDANRTIDNKNSKISMMKKDIDSIKSDLEVEREQRQQIEESFERFKSSMNEIAPFIVKNTSFDYSTGYLSFDYYGFRDANLTLKVRALGENYYYNTSSSSNVNIEKGNHSKSIYLSRYLDGGRWHIFELLIGDRVVGGCRK